MSVLQALTQPIEHLFPYPAGIWTQLVVTSSRERDSQVDEDGRGRVAHVRSLRATTWAVGDVWWRICTAIKHILASIMRRRRDSVPPYISCGSQNDLALT